MAEEKQRLGNTNTSFDDMDAVDIVNLAQQRSRQSIANKQGQPQQLNQQQQQRPPYFYNTGQALMNPQQYPATQHGQYHSQENLNAYYASQNELNFNSTNSSAKQAWVI